MRTRYENFIKKRDNKKLKDATVAELIWALNETGQFTCQEIEEFIKEYSDGTKKEHRTSYWFPEDDSECQIDTENNVWTEGEWNLTY